MENYENQWTTMMMIYAIFGTRTDDQKAIEALNTLETPLDNAKLCLKE